jgi:hypothetical protein
VGIALKPKAISKQVKKVSLEAIKKACRRVLEHGGGGSVCDKDIKVVATGSPARQHHHVKGKSGKRKLRGRGNGVVADEQRDMNLVIADQLLVVTKWERAAGRAQ